VGSYFALACAITWALATPVAWAWLHRQTPSQLAIASLGFSAFGPLVATLIVTRQDEWGAVFGRWRTAPRWVLLALCAPPAIHLLARLLSAALGSPPAAWLYPPVTPETLAALVVFPLGEEFGLRGFAQPRLVARFGAVRGPLLLGVLWCVWHLAYAVLPSGAYNFQEIAVGMLELPLYSVLIAWTMKHAQQSMWVALAFHAGGHLDHIERDPGASLLLHLCHVAVLLVLAGFAARALRRA
jgi:membrane protease YdiL (CAAX protease family)